METLGAWERFLHERGRIPDLVQCALMLIDALFVNPYMTVSRAQQILKVSNPTARQAVSGLEKAGMLTEVTGRDWGRLYLARSILRAIDKGHAG